MERVYTLEKIDITPFLKAKQKLKDSLAAENTELNRDASIQRFEFTFELSWKTMKRILAERGTFLNSPKPIIREAAKDELLQDVESWFTFLAYRNQTVHTYNDNIAVEIYNALPNFYTLVEQFYQQILTLNE